MAASKPDGWLRAGAVGAPHGLDGSFHVRQANPGLLIAGASVRVSDRELRIERRAGSDRRVILRLAGHADRMGARSLGGQELYVARDRAPALGPDEWWAEDLVGCVVHDRRGDTAELDLGDPGDGSKDAGAVVGTVSRLIALPSCEALEVARTHGAPALLVPLVRDAVYGVDLERRTIEIDLRFLTER
ncbi:MAG: ribosome maturation factor RimM [Solirubrobacteraceae bacterium]